MLQTGKHRLSALLQKLPAFLRLREEFLCNYLEVHAMVYAFDAPNDEALSNTIFVNYKFFNRSTNDYHDTYLGLWNDWDIGYAWDDYVGCDVQRGSSFAYNGLPVC